MRLFKHVYYFYVKEARERDLTQCQSRGFVLRTDRCKIKLLHRYELRICHVIAYLPPY